MDEKLMEMADLERERRMYEKLEQQRDAAMEIVRRIVSEVNALEKHNIKTAPSIGLAEALDNAEALLKEQEQK